MENNMNNNNQVQFGINEDLTWLEERIDYLLYQSLSFAVRPLQGRSISPAMRTKIVQLFNSKGFGPGEHEEIFRRIQLAAKYLRPLWRESSAGRLQAPRDNNGVPWKEMMGLEDGNAGLLEEIIAEKLMNGHYSPQNPTVEDSCCICLAAYQEGERTGGLRCSHVFHWECAWEWLKLQNQCPVCKGIGLDVGPPTGPAQK